MDVKKGIRCLLCLVACSLAAWGQDVSAVNGSKKTVVVPYFGLKAGLNIADQWGPDVPKNRSVALGANAAVSVPIDINPWVMLDPELQYTMKGTQWDTVQPGHENFTYSRSLQYLEVPVTLKLSVPVAGMVKPYIYLGAAGGVRLAATESNWGEGTHSVPRSIADTISVVDASVVGGACLHVFVGPGYLQLDGRFTLGLWDVDRSEKSTRNWTAALSLGYAWKLKKEKKLW
jgi:hypothetical protein